MYHYMVRVTVFVYFSVGKSIYSVPVDQFIQVRKGNSVIVCMYILDTKHIRTYA